MQKDILSILKVSENIRLGCLVEGGVYHNETTHTLKPISIKNV